MTTQPPLGTRVVLWLYENALGVMGALIGLLLLMTVGAVYLESRVSSLQASSSANVPRVYKAPDLSAYTPASESDTAVSTTATYYVPAYSHIYHRGGKPYLLETTLSIRNTDPKNRLTVTSVTYHDDHGYLAKTFVDRPIELGPLETIDFLVEQHDSSGGSGANFLAHVGTGLGVSRPVIESVMVGTIGHQGICFARSGVEIGTEAGTPSE